MRLTHASQTDLNLLVVFDALLEAGSVSGAAIRLGLTQSATSRALGRLREAFGDPLFVRSGRGLTTTRLARELAAPLRRSLSDIEGLLVQKGTFEPGSARRRFVVAAIDYPQHVVLAPLVRRLSVEAPGVELAIHPVSAANDRALETGEIDLVLSPQQPSGAGIVWTRLFDDEYVLVVAADHPVQRFTLKRFLEHAHVFVAPRGRAGGAVDEALAARGLRRRIAVQVPTFSLVPELLAGTRLVAAVPSRMARLLTERHPLRVVAPPLAIPGFTMCQAWHEAHRDDPGHRWLRGECARAGRL